MAATLPVGKFIESHWEQLSIDFLSALDAEDGSEKCAKTKTKSKSKFKDIARLNQIIVQKQKTNANLCSALNSSKTHFKGISRMRRDVLRLLRLHKYLHIYCEHTFIY